MTTSPSEYLVTGMTCGGCARALHNALAEQGVSIPLENIDVTKGTVLIDPSDEAKLRQAVEDAGFDMGS